MTKRMGRVRALLLGGLVVGGCGAADESPPADDVGAGSVEQPIVRATANGGRNEVVLLHIVTVNDVGQLGTRFCTGAYYAPRVVVTAAHCLVDVFETQLFVYHGDDFTQDLPQLAPDGPFLVPPAPGQPSKWAKADSFEQHPAYDPVLKHPDLGVVYLDRRLPFDPLPLARFRLDQSFVNRQVTISGWGHSVATSPTTAIGGRVQRTGRSRFLGSPTLADFHPEDPNPGLLNATVRQNQVKTDGRAPSSNACFGDSGAAILVNRFGQDYIAAIGYFVGLSCEDYSLWTRLDPFLPFLDESYRRGGQAPLIPRRECVGENVDGSLTAYFAYRNENGIFFDIPHGSKNSLALDVAGFRPTRFAPGDHPFAFGVDFAPGQTLSYRLSPENSPTTTITMNQSSPRCAGTDADCAGFCRALARSGCENLQPFADCFLGCATFTNDIAELVPECSAANVALNRCVADAAPGVENWLCIPEASFALPPECDPEIAALDVCLAGG